MNFGRLSVLVLVCAGLGGLVWLDNQQDDEGRQPIAASKPLDTRRAKELIPAKTPSPPTLQASQKASQTLKSANPLAAIKKLSLKATVERPLFAPSRHRPRPVKVVPRRVVKKVKRKRKPPLYVLLGILSDGDRAIALLREKSNGLNFRVEVGDVIGGWRVAKVEHRSVLLKWNDGRSMELSLFEE